MPGSTGRSEMKDASNDGEGWAKKRVATAAQLDNLVLNPILLRGEGERSGRCRQELGLCAGLEIQAQRADEELDVGEGERGRLGRRVSILARPKEIEKGDDDHIRHRTEGMSIRRQVCRNHGNTSDDLDGDGLDPIGWRVLLLPAGEHATDPKIRRPRRG